MANEVTKEKLDIELEAPADFTSPEELYQDLIATIRKYHPSDDITTVSYTHLTTRPMIRRCPSRV